MKFPRSALLIGVSLSTATCSVALPIPWRCCGPRNTGLSCTVAKLLITGGAGFIGANFVLSWRRHQPGDHIVVLDALTYAGNRSNLESIEGDRDFEFIHGDICDTGLVQNLFRRHDFDLVVHFAAESHVD